MTDTLRFSISETAGEEKTHMHALNVVVVAMSSTGAESERPGVSAETQQTQSPSEEASV